MKTNPNPDTSISKICRITYLLPLIAPIVVITTFVFFYKAFLFCSANNPCSPVSAAQIFAGVGDSDQVRVSAYVGRATWTLVNGVHLLACLVTFATAGIVIYNALSLQYDRKVRWMIVLIVGAMALDISLAMAWWTAGDIWSPAQQLFRATVGQVVPAINKYNRVAEALSLGGALSLAAAASSALWQRTSNDDQDELLKRVRLLRPILMVGATALVVAILRLSVTHAWAASYLLPESPLAKNVSSLVTGIVVSMGTVYTLLMASIYLPAALMLRTRVLKLAAGKTDQEQEKFLSDNGLNLSFMQLLPRVLALFAPLLAGPLGELLVRATKELGG